MLTKARQILVSELALAQKSTGEEASEVLDGVLATIVAA
jgi:CarD family transcriptional regulator